MLRPARILRALLGASVLWGVACSPPVAEVVIQRIIVDAPRGYGSTAESRDAVSAGIRRRLLQDGSVRVVQRRDAATHSLQVILGAVGDHAGPSIAGGMLPLQVRLKPVETAAQGLLFETVVHRQYRPQEVGDVLAAFDDAWAALARLRALAAQSDAAVIAALQDDDVRVRGFAMTVLGQRRTRAAVPPLCAVLANEQESALVLRAIGSLVAIGDQRAVGPLIETTRQKDPSFVLQVVFAVAALGGRTAEGFLVTLADGHPSEEVQRGAKDALEELAARQARRAPSAAAPAP